MISESVMRLSLLASVPFNLVAAGALAFPGSALGAATGNDGGVVPPLYAYTLGFIVALFGVAYGWLALQTEIDRLMVGFAAVAKAGVFAIAAGLWLADDGAGRVVVVASGDLVFAVLWLSWLVSRRAARP